MPETGMGSRKFPMLTSAMLRRLLIAIAALSISMFFAAEGFAMANTHAVAHSKLDTSASGGWVHGDIRASRDGARRHAGMARQP
jgi:hypothetical protein